MTHVKYDSLFVWNGSNDAIDMKFTVDMHYAINIDLVKMHKSIPRSIFFMIINIS